MYENVTACDLKVGDAFHYGGNVITVAKVREIDQTGEEMAQHSYLTGITTTKGFEYRFPTYFQFTRAEGATT